MGLLSIGRRETEHGRREEMVEVRKRSWDTDTGAPAKQQLEARNGACMPAAIGPTPLQHSNCRR